MKAALSGAAFFVRAEFVCVGMLYDVGQDGVVPELGVG